MIVKEEKGQMYSPSWTTALAMEDLATLDKSRAAIAE